MGLDLDRLVRRVLKGPALAEYQRALDLALAEYDRVTVAALAECQRAKAAALAENCRVTAAASAKYWGARAQALISALALAEVEQ